ncbi:hypothetical protein [Dyadobacter sp. CY323]|uniref:hypothetical protein n=1 Tax=Dyadobacter sp. CY323 TaxID=2907302 RepID=UPI001F35440A|nr:hypothetical protein [Dyadobacter sp. CY323]MCE6989748.1 hypothetical protein [Dyadobacter sp. CY323]
MLNFDERLTAYTLAGFLLILIFSILFVRTLVSGQSLREVPTRKWAMLFFALLLFMRLPFIAYNHELEVDESQMLAQALSLSKHWVYWKYVDGLTQGPLTIYALIVPSWLGMPFDYTTARVMGFIVLTLTLLLTYLTFENLLGRKTALLVFAPTALFYLLSQGFFSALYNEYLVLLILAFCFWVFSVIYNRVEPEPGWLFLLSFAAGTVPFAKLQGVPSAMLIVVFAALLVFRRSTSKFRDLIVLLSGGIAFPLIVLVLTLRFDAFDYFWKFYIIGNMEYSGGGTLLTKLLAFPDFLLHSGQFIFLLFSYLVLIFWTLTKIIRNGALAKLSSLLFFFALSSLLLAFYSVIKPGYYFQHYLQFLIIPLGLVSGELFKTAVGNQKWESETIKKASLGWLAVCILPHFVMKTGSSLGYASTQNIRIASADLGLPLQETAAVTEIKKYIRPGENMTVWGWKPAYHLETGTAQGTADVMIYRLVTPSPKQVNYVEKYVKDLEHSKPVVFVDEITYRSIWFSDPALYSHDKVPAVRDFVSKYYSYVATVDGEKIYVRKDRLTPSQRKPALPEL